MRNALLSIKFHCAPISFGDYEHTNHACVAGRGTMFYVYVKNMYTILYAYFVCGKRKVVVQGETGGVRRYILTLEPFVCTINLWKRT